MDREELLEAYWKAYQAAAIRHHNCDVGELDEVEDWERESIADALEAAIKEVADAE